MPEIHRFFGHPLFFVHDATMELSSSDIPEIADREPPLIWKTERVLAVGTIPDVDGEVQIVLDHGPELVGNLVFSGRLPTPSGTLAVAQSSAEEILRISGLGPITNLSVGVDDRHFPSRVHLLAS
jgi:hypothetical protein